MSKDEMTLALEGEVNLTDFSKALKDFEGLVQELNKEISDMAKIEWAIENLELSSAIVTARGISSEISSVEKIVAAYDSIGESLEKGEVLPFSPKIANRVNSLIGIIDGQITAIRFQTNYGDRIIGGKDKLTGEMVITKYAYGAIQGHVESMSMRKNLTFKLWDKLFDKVVSCYITEGFKEKMRDVWDRDVIVTGIIGRKSDSGIPVVIKEITEIEIVENMPKGTYKKAKGVFAKVCNDELPEVTLRKLRDGES